MEENSIHYSFASLEVIAEHAQFVKTGELLQLEIVRLPPDGAAEGVLVLRAQEISTSEHFELVLDREIIDEIDPDDPWGEVPASTV